MESNGKSITKSRINYDLWDRFLTVLTKESKKKESSAPPGPEGQLPKVMPAKVSQVEVELNADKKNISKHN